MAGGSHQRVGLIGKSRWRSSVGASRPRCWALGRVRMVVADGRSPSRRGGVAVVVWAAKRVRGAGWAAGAGAWWAQRGAGVAWGGGDWQDGAAGLPDR